MVVTTEENNQIQVQNPGLNISIPTPRERELFFLDDSLAFREGNEFIAVEDPGGIGFPIAGYQNRLLGNLGISDSTLRRFNRGDLLQSGQSPFSVRRLIDRSDIPGELIGSTDPRLQQLVQERFNEFGNLIKLKGLNFQSGSTAITRKEDPAKIADSLNPNSQENINARQQAAVNQSTLGAKIQDRETLDKLSSQGLAESDIIRRGEDIFLKPGSRFESMLTGISPAPSASGLGTKISSPSALAEIAKSLGITPQNESQFLNRVGQDIYLKPEALQAFVDPNFRGGVTGQAREAQAQQVLSSNVTELAPTSGQGGETDLPTDTGEVIPPYKDLLAKYGVPETNPSENPVTTFANTYKQLLTDLGIPDIKSAFDEVNQKYVDLQSELNDKISDINDNPWLTEGARVGQIRSLEKKYEGKLSILTNQMKLYNSLYEQGLSEARFVAGAAFNQAQFDTNTQLKLLDLAQDEAQALRELKELDTQVVLVGGRKLLINSQTGETIKDLGVSSESSGSVGTGFSSTERKKLEQAGLLNASRQAQLDYLYGGVTNQDVEFYVKQYLESNEDLVNSDGSLNLSAIPQDLRTKVFNRISQEESLAESRESQQITSRDVVKQLPSAIFETLSAPLRWFNIL